MGSPSESGKRRNVLVGMTASFSSRNRDPSEAARQAALRGMPSGSNAANSVSYLPPVMLRCPVL